MIKKISDVEFFSEFVYLIILKILRLVIMVFDSTKLLMNLNIKLN